MPAIAAFVYLLSSGANLKWRGYLTLTTIVLPSVLLGIFDLLFNYDPLLTWNFEFRMVGNNGFLSGKYYAFFLDMPKGLYADSVGGMFVSPVYNRPIAEVVGEDFSQLAGNHANANLWADGYGNLGLWGVALSSLEALLLFWLIDSFSRNKDLRLSTALMIPVGFALSNTAVHSMLTSNGGLLLLLLLVVMPRSLFDRVGPT